MDIFTLDSRSCTLWEGVGPWGRTRRLVRGEARQVTLQRSRTLTAMIGARLIKLTTFGTEADRRWLRDLLQPLLEPNPDAAAEGADAVRGRSAAAEAPPPGYQVERLPGGTWRLEVRPGRRAAGAG